ncbi:hypothetical protein BXT86_00845 [candidate division WOR-3 bacterium 4484_100]|uniref:L-2-amino-thiazoline-4-carboxylic acid hydrolase n=1 Tax=candidate division WOR-3 bacterium 4484_100 TaxID=1936077 RepID=A0A1V4QGN0_UNCW3|nr:MAG: hypothetical protein BXT86_00845 [candidate division WOR-3 bacterium 4484_100]
MSLSPIIEPSEMESEELYSLLVDAAKNWLAHDGLWFQAVEKRFGIESAIELDREAWKEFTQIEARRIMKRLGMKPGGGIPALAQALKFRLYAYINQQEITEVSEDRCVFRMLSCRVQEARKRKGLPDFPCKSVGIVEYTYFARVIDPRIETRPIFCPPDPHPPDCFCAWEFILKK